MRTDDYVNEMGEEEVANTQTGLSLELNSLIKINKATIKEKVDAVVMSIQEGWTDPVDALILAKKGGELFTLLEKNVRPIAEAKPVGKDFRKFDCEITEGMTGVKYDYTYCNDPEWLDLLNKSKAAKEALEKREAFLKGVSSKLELVNTDTGETYTINPPVKSGRMGFSLSIK